jgi:hypothetical protein
MRGWKLRGFGVNSAPQKTLSPPPPRTLSEFFAERAANYGRPLPEPFRRLPKASWLLSMSSMTSNDPSDETKPVANQVAEDGAPAQSAQGQKAQS